MDRACVNSNRVDSLNRYAFNKRTETHDSISQTHKEQVCGAFNNEPMSRGRTIQSTLVVKDAPPTGTQHTPDSKLNSHRESLHERQTSHVEGMLV